MKILRRQTGLSLVELLITMVIFVLVIVAASNIFIGILGQYKQQSKIAETNIEGLVGLQMLRSDIEQAGYGLPYDIGTANYLEALNDAATTQNDTSFNDEAGAADAPPRAVLTGVVAAGGNGLPNTYVSDVLVLKATNIAMNDTARKWAAVSNTPAGNIISTWTNVSTGLPLTSENLATNDRVTVVRPTTGASQRVLMNSGGAFYTTTAVLTSGFFPTLNSDETYIVYGISPSTANPRMPFNRADYYVRIPNPLLTPMPTHCAPQTGILYKAALNHADGNLSEFPLLDCVAAMKIVLARDSNGDSSTDAYSTAGAWPVLTGAGATTAVDIRTQLKEVRVYVVTHEGQRDPGFTFPTANLTVTDPDAGLLLTYPLPDRNYRWKVYTMVLKPYNLR